MGWTPESNILAPRTRKAYVVDFEPNPTFSNPTPMNMDIKIARNACIIDVEVQKRRPVEMNGQAKLATEANEARSIFLEIIRMRRTGGTARAFAI
mmetsp:Transcript_953/g.1659  ORF Transcript_953/g.1659 Transcript_953/m.1659 type:complete len:95 (+) Transcript_953:79-363(+)